MQLTLEAVLKRIVGSEGECEKQFTDTNTSPTLKTICSIFTPVAGLKCRRRSVKEAKSRERAAVMRKSFSY
jgi:hypothetical protein